MFALILQFHWNTELDLDALISKVKRVHSRHIWYGVGGAGSAELKLSENCVKFFMNFLPKIVVWNISQKTQKPTTNNIDQKKLTEKIKQSIPLADSCSSEFSDVEVIKPPCTIIKKKKNKKK